MTTRFYFHAASSTVSGTLPSTQQQSAITTSFNIDAVTVNRNMNTTIGTSQANLTASITFTANPQHVYVTRFISDPIAAQTIAANTWTFYHGSSTGSSSNGWDNAGTGKNYIAIYVWRPSTGANIGFIANALSATASSNLGSASERAELVTYTGSSVTSLAGDVIAAEMIGSGKTLAARSVNWQYDGTVSTTGDGVVASTIASYLETPGTIAFAAGAITATTSPITIRNKYITKY